MTNPRQNELNDEMTTIRTTITTTTFHIIGDAFVDLFCFLKDDNNLPQQAGGDVRLDQPVQAYAGGSGLNTATHLQSLLLSSSSLSSSKKQQQQQRHSNNNNVGGDSSGESSTVLLFHTCLNPNDQYGQLLEKHAQEYGFPLINCLQKTLHHSQLPTIHNGNNNNNNNNSNNSSSTGHCIIIVAGGERSFMTHVGCLEHFQASDLDMNRILYHHHHHHDATDANNTTNNKPEGCGGGAMHIHIAGYYNLSGFHNGNLATQLELIRKVRQEQQQYYPTVISLVAQHDATQQWDGGLEKDVMPYLDFLILNELEANHIVTNCRQRRLRQQRQEQKQKEEGVGSKLDNNNMMNCPSSSSSSCAATATDAATSTPPADSRRSSSSNSYIADDTTTNTTKATTTTITTTSGAAVPLLDPQEWISYFFGSSDSNNPNNDNCIVIVTHGAQGAMAFGHDHNSNNNYGNIIAKVEPAVPIPIILDPTGAGDAFAAGFLHGIWEHYWHEQQLQQQQDQHTNSSSSTTNKNAQQQKQQQRVAWSAKAIRHGLMWGCAAGTATVSIRGASIPPQHKDIQRIYKQQQMQQQQQQRVSGGGGQE